VHAHKPAAAPTPAVGGATGHPGQRSACWVALGVAASLVAVYVLVALGRTSLALGASALCATIALSWGLPLAPSARAPGAAKPAGTNIGHSGRHVAPPSANIGQGEPGRYLDIDAVEVEAVYVLGAEVFTHLTGGVGRVLDPLSGNERHIETSEVSLTWRCQGRRSAAKLADRLNEWESRGAHLRLMATRGRCALLIEDDDNWVALPELRLSA
jgi:hypothetical protein